MHLPFNIIDLVILGTFGGAALIAFRRGLFAALFDLIRIFVGFAVSVVVYQSVTQSIVYFSSFKENQIALVIQLSCFGIIWFFFGWLRPYFDTLAARLFSSSMLLFKIQGYIAAIPAAVTAFILVTISFAVLLVFPTTSQAHKLALASFWGKKIAPLVYSLSISTKDGLVFAPYNGLVAKLSEKPATLFASATYSLNSKLALPKNQQTAAFEQSLRINEVRQEKGLAKVTPPPIMVTKAVPLPADTPKVGKPQPIPVPKVSKIAGLPIGGQPHPPATQAPANTPVPITIVLPTQVPIATSLPATPPLIADISAMEQRVFNLTNQQRQANNLPPFSWDDNIAAVARAHSQDMVTRNFFAHNNPDGLDPFLRMRLGGITFQYAAENIAGNQSAEFAAAAWINSPGHRANILNPNLHKLGVGIAQGSQYGFMFTQDFTD